MPTTPRNEINNQPMMVRDSEVIEFIRKVRPNATVIGIDEQN